MSTLSKSIQAKLNVIAKGRNLPNGFFNPFVSSFEIKVAEAVKVLDEEYKVKVAGVVDQLVTDDAVNEVFKVGVTTTVKKPRTPKKNKKTEQTPPPEQSGDPANQKQVSVTEQVQEPEPETKKSFFSLGRQ